MVTLLVGLSAGPFAAPVAAEEWPNRAIRFIVPFPAGGSTDIAARLVANKISLTLGQQVVVENKTGAAGNIGFEAAAKSPADGYTVLIAPDSLASAAHVFQLGIDPRKDFVPVIELTRQPVVLAVNPSLGVGSVAELVALAKKQPGMSYATSGVGSQQHMVAEWFAKLAGIKLEHVPYRGGGQAINDLIAGHIKIGSLGSSPVIPHAKAGTLKILAQSTARRSPGLEDVPTYTEAGIALELDQWVGAFVPAGTPPVVVARLDAEIAKALADPEVRDGFLQSGQEPVVGTSGAEFAKLFQDEYAKYQRLVTELNLKVQ
ncbi:MAG: tripartite tricarboxylate transporter substrate binding protein [Rhodoplanes sp.]|uniref:Bug family tripartite tricarboxylate transporter substrate binding protein n=1 Tax=Rhodoplanes sp. TaxID=1968906 RepID=UPI0017C45DD4|nr:tripartite tricarboxylate transporter substrate binding protein [Rhodoplanes sp.]NVO17817.1 tripartite tricarboxylate transporter substrate binding protein [Rhodoplanes sp.]